MRSSSLVLLFSLAVSAAAQNATFLAEFVQELQRENLTSLAQAASRINGTTTGQFLLSVLGTEPQTIFAPNNNAWAGAHPNITSDPELLADVLSYHVVPGTFNTTATFPNTTIGRTLFNASNLVFLEGNKSQVLAWSNKSDGQVHILNQNTPAIVTVQNSTQFQNLTINVVDVVIDVPGELTAAISANNLTSFSSAATTAGVLNPLNTKHGVTVFAPNDAAFSAIQQNLTQAGSNTTVLQDILLNHVINGSSVYSGNLISQGSATTAAGQSLSASFNSSGGFITVGNATAKIVTPDIILWNGVLHIIDHVLFDEQVDQGAASSAASSAAAAATSSTTESGPIGFTPTPTSANGSGTSSAAGSVTFHIPIQQVGAAGLISTLGLILGSLLVF